MLVLLVKIGSPALDANTPILYMTNRINHVTASSRKTMQHGQEKIICYFSGRCLLY